MESVKVSGSGQQEQHAGGSEWEKLAHGAAGRRRPLVHAAIIAPRALVTGIPDTRGARSDDTSRGDTITRTNTYLADVATADLEKFTNLLFTERIVFFLHQISISIHVN